MHARHSGTGRGVNPQGCVAYACGRGAGEYVRQRLAVGKRSAEGVLHMRKIVQGIGIYIAIAGAGIAVSGAQGKEIVMPGLSYGDIRTSDFTFREGPDGELIGLGVLMVSIGLAAIIIPSVRQGSWQISGRGLLSRSPAFLCWILGAIGIQLSAKVFDGFPGYLSAAAGFGLIALGARLFAEAKRAESPSATLKLTGHCRIWR